MIHNNTIRTEWNLNAISGLTRSKKWVIFLPTRSGNITINEFPILLTIMSDLKKKKKQRKLDYSSGGGNYKLFIRNREIAMRTRKRYRKGIFRTKRMLLLANVSPRASSPARLAWRPCYRRWVWRWRARCRKGFPRAQARSVIPYDKSGELPLLSGPSCNKRILAVCSCNGGSALQRGGEGTISVNLDHDFSYGWNLPSVCIQETLRIFRKDGSKLIS